MLTWARRIAIFLLLGAVANVAVAWACAFAQTEVVPHRGGFEHPTGDANRAISVTRRFGWQYVIDFEFTRQVRSKIVGDGPLPRYDSRMWWPDEGHQPINRRGYLGCGWPMLSLIASVAPEPTFVALQGQSGKRPVVRTGIAINPRRLGTPPSVTIPDIIPIGVLWHGFAENTLVYAGVIALLTLSAGAIRRNWCRLNNRCAACGYPRGTSPVCTECGATLPTVITK